MNKSNVDINGKFIILVVVLIGIIGLGSSAFVVVESGHVGVIRTLGAVQPNSLKEGFHLKKPFIDKIEQVDIRLTSSVVNTTAASKDLQIVTTNVTTQFSLNGEVAPKTYQTVGVLSKVNATVIEPAIQESVKAVTAKFTAEQLVTQREQVKINIQEAISKFIDVTLSEKNLANAVKIANVAITDFNFSTEFDRAIEMKVKAEQEALQAKNEKMKRVTQAEASAAEKELAADALAYAITAESEARAASIQREAEALRGNPDLIKLRAIEKWDGVLPKFTTSDDATPMFLIEPKEIE